MKMKTVLITLGALLVLSGGVIANETANERALKVSSGQPLQARLNKNLKQLALTPEQQVAIQALVAEHRQNRAPRSEAPFDRQAWRTLMDAPQFDKTSARELLEKRQGRQLEQQLHAMQLQHQIRQLLTDEQRQQLDSQRAKKRSERTKERRRSKAALAES
ncbi:Spy/CpxP family protein refolding chaperone [Alishewanella sp. d11]|uniref:Spy/CpxP family protein refolding chaperone n=1 Tax=Alishewanella sp. d11 TaxID=3414030 RepID=UPI003BF8924C